MNLHLIFSSALVVSAMTLSLVTCDLGTVFELVGATSACAMAYILPPLLYQAHDALMEDIRRLGSRRSGAHGHDNKHALNLSGRSSKCSAQACPDISGASS